jgi:hypothetical protein
LRAFVFAACARRMIALFQVADEVALADPAGR